MISAISRITRAAALILVLLLPVSACVRVNNSFSVSNPHHSASSVEVRLCGESTKLSQTARGFYGSVPISCEGEGKVVVQFADGRQASCIIGYFTPGMMQNYDYVIEGAECRVVAVRVGAD